jgi:hypothetical protein
LRPGGQLHIADWGRPTGPVMRGLFLVVRLTDGLAVTRDNATCRLLLLVSQAGVAGIGEGAAMNMMFGTLRFIAAVKPESP